MNTFKETYKSTVPRIIDRIGYYDKHINNNKHKFIVPMYHRVINNISHDPFKLGMCVTSATFSTQLEYYSNQFKMISFLEYVESRNIIDNDSNSYLTITFDDGYKDNLLNALPIIKKYNIPATIFVCTQIFNDKSNFWWDSVIHALNLSTLNLIDLSDLNIDGLNVINLSKSKFNTSRYVLGTLWNSHAYKDKQLLNELVARLLNGQQEPIIGHLTEKDIKELTANGVEIAAHTLTHADLTSISKSEAKYEIEKSKAILSEILNTDVKGFAYPAGFQNSEVEEIVKNAGFVYAASTNTGVNYTFNPFAIERIGMPETNLADLKRSICNYSK